MKNKEQMCFHMCHHQTLDYKLDSVLQRFALTAYISFFFFTTVSCHPKGPHASKKLRFTSQH